MKGGHFHEESALAHADLNMQRRCPSERLRPASRMLLRIMYDKTALRNRFSGARNIFQSHLSFLSPVLGRYSCRLFCLILPDPAAKEKENLNFF